MPSETTLIFKVHWPLNEDVFYTAAEQDEKAKNMYRELLFKWYNRTTESETEHPNNGCLAIARSVYCAYQFPRCKDYQNQKQALCSFVCELYLERCSKEEDLYDLMCGEKNPPLSDDDFCSFGMSLRALTTVLIMLGLYLV